MNTFVHVSASCFKFYRSCLTAADQYRYDVIVSGLWTFQERIRVSNSSGSCSIDDLVKFIKLDNPELFFVDFERIKIIYRPMYIDVFLSYIYKPSQAKRIGKKLAARIEDILTTSEVSTLSIYGRELFFHDFLQTRIAYEHKDFDYYKAHSIEGALLHGRAVCEGYAGAFKLLCDKAGLPALVVSGTTTQEGKTENHAWNIVKFHKQYYHVDVTWDSTTAFDGEACHVYFNLTDHEICQNHNWNRAMVPSCDSTEYNYYKKNQLFFPDSAGLIQYFIRQLQAGERFYTVKTDPHTQSIETVSHAFQQALLKCPARLAIFTYQIQYDKFHGVVSIRMCVKP